MQLTNKEEKHRAAVNLSWSHVQGLHVCTVVYILHVHVHVVYY